MMVRAPVERQFSLRTNPTRRLEVMTLLRVSRVRMRSWVRVAAVESILGKVDIVRGIIRL